VREVVAAAVRPSDGQFVADGGSRRSSTSRGTSKRATTSSGLVVFAQPADLQLLGARTLDGLDLTIDPARRRLVAAGPLPAATAA
jgi:hypothetical protein